MAEAAKDALRWLIHSRISQLVQNDIAEYATHGCHDVLNDCGLTSFFAVSLDDIQRLAERVPGAPEELIAGFVQGGKFADIYLNGPWHVEVFPEGELHDSVTLVVCLNCVVIATANPMLKLESRLTGKAQILRDARRAAQDALCFSMDDSGAVAEPYALAMRLVKGEFSKSAINAMNAMGFDSSTRSRAAGGMLTFMPFEYCFYKNPLLLAQMTARILCVMGEAYSTVLSRAPDSQVAVAMLQRVRLCLRSIVAELLDPQSLNAFIPITRPGDISERSLAYRHNVLRGSLVRLLTDIVNVKPVVKRIVLRSLEFREKCQNVGPADRMRYLYIDADPTVRDVVHAQTTPPSHLRRSSGGGGSGGGGSSAVKRKLDQQSGPAVYGSTRFDFGKQGSKTDFFGLQLTDVFGGSVFTQADYDESLFGMLVADQPSQLRSAVARLPGLAAFAIVLPMRNLSASGLFNLKVGPLQDIQANKASPWATTLAQLAHSFMPLVGVLASCLSDALFTAAEAGGEEGGEGGEGGRLINGPGQGLCGRLLFGHREPVRFSDEPGDKPVFFICTRLMKEAEAEPSTCFCNHFTYTYKQGCGNIVAPLLIALRCGKLVTAVQQAEEWYKASLVLHKGTPSMARKNTITSFLKQGCKRSVASTYSVATNSWDMMCDGVERASKELLRGDEAALSAVRWFDKPPQAPRAVILEEEEEGI